MTSETNRIECKHHQLVEDLEKEAIAFLNYQESGKIYIDVDKTGTVVGVSDINDYMLKIKNLLKNIIMLSCMGLFDLVAENIDSNNVLKSHLPVKQRNCTIHKTYNVGERYIYLCWNACTNESIFAKRIPNSIVTIKSPNQNLTSEQLKISYKGSKKTLNQQFA